MKITKEQLKQIIKEELETIMSEYSAVDFKNSEAGLEDDIERKLQKELAHYEQVRQKILDNPNIDVRALGLGITGRYVPSTKEVLEMVAKKIAEIGKELKSRGKAPGMPSYAGTQFGGDDRFEQ